MSNYTSETLKQKVTELCKTAVTNLVSSRTSSKNVNPESTFFDEVRLDTKFVIALKTHGHSIEEMRVADHQPSHFEKFFTSPEHWIALNGSTCCNCCKKDLKLTEAFVVWSYQLRTLSVPCDGLMCRGCAEDAADRHKAYPDSIYPMASPLALSYLRPFKPAVLNVLESDCYSGRGLGSSATSKTAALRRCPL